MSRGRLALALALCVLAAPAGAQVSFSSGPAMWAPSGAACAQHWSATQISSSLTGGGTNTATNTATNTDETAYGGQNQTSGKYYVEFAFTALLGDGNSAFGFGNTSSAVTSGTYLGEGTDSIGFYMGNVSGTLFINNANAVSYTALVIAPLDRFAMAIDITNKLLWIKDVTGATSWYGSSPSAAGDPVAETNGFSFSADTITAHPVVPGITLFQNAETGTGYFASASWLGAAPSGYSAFCS